MTAVPHVPVLLDETLDLLEPAPGKRIVDGTFGFGGHARAMLEAGAEVLGLDLDDAAFASCRDLARGAPGLSCLHMSFRDLGQAMARQGWRTADGLLLDLGVSSHQLDDAGKGFSYRQDGPLDLRFDQGRGEPAAHLLSTLDEAEIADLIWRFGEERGSRRIARAIVHRRCTEPVATTAALRSAVQAAIPAAAKPEPVLSRVFQALRIAVNEELTALSAVLESLAPNLAGGGRFVVIAYHSLEDRLVKRFIDREKRDCICPPEVPSCVCGHRAVLKPLTRKVVKATPEEVGRNARARSARLRGGQVI